jgi:DNA adenine methylase
MRYFGGKARLAKHIIPNLDMTNKSRFVDLFCGSCNVSSALGFHNTLVNDINKYIVAVYREVYNNGIKNLPEEVSESFYQDVKLNKDNYPDYIVGFVGFGCSFSGKFFGGYARSNAGQNYVNNARSTLLKKRLRGTVEFSNLPYSEVPLYDFDLVYCDIPYFNTTGYASGNFDHDEFYRWVLKQPCTIIVSEYKHNAVIEPFWEKKSNKGTKDKSGSRVETTEVLMAFNT